MWINIYPKLEQANRINYLTRTVTSQQTQCKLCELWRDPLMMGLLKGGTDIQQVLVRLAK